MAPQHVGVGGVEDGGLHRAPEQGRRVVDQVGVHRVVAGDHDHQRPLPASARAPGLLPERRHRPRETGLHHRVEPADVDAQLQGVGGGHSEQIAVVEAALDLAAVLGQVAGAVGLDAVADVAAAALCQALPHAQRDGLGRAPRPRERQRPGAVDEQVRHDVGGLRHGGPAHGRAVLAGQVGQQAGLPQGDGAFADRRAVVEHRLHGLADQPRGLRRRIGRRRGGEHHRRVRAVVAGHAQQAPQDQRDVGAEYPAVGVALVDDDVLQLPQHPRPPLVPGEHADVQHVRVGEDPPRTFAHRPPHVLGRVPVVGRDLHGVHVAGFIA